MKVTVRDSEILKTIEPSKLKAYLQAKAWVEERQLSDRAAVWLWKGSSEDEHEILLPLRQDLGDYAARMSDALKVLEVVEQRSQLEILSDLITSMRGAQVQGFIVDVDPEAGYIALMGFVVNRLRKIYVELTKTDAELALKAYQEGIPVICYGDLVQSGQSFILKNPHQFALTSTE